MLRQLLKLQGQVGRVILAGCFLAAIGLISPQMAAAQSSCTAIQCTCTSGELPQGSGQDLVINTGECFAKHKNSPFNFHSVNIYGGGELHFADDGPIDFYAESILIEYKGAMTAGLPTAAGSYKSQLTIHLFGKAGDPGIVCKSAPQPKGAPCGIPDELWTANPDMAMHMNMGGTQSLKAKNAACNSIQGYDQYLPPVQGKDDCFYQYEIQDPQDLQANRQAFFGHKVLAVSFGGKLQLFGSEGTTYLTEPGTCDPAEPANECSPANTGSSWRRLTAISADKKTLTLNNPSSPVTWKAGDHVVVTTTDYLPSHSEEAILLKDAAGNQLMLKTALTYPHNASVFPIPGTVPSDIGPVNDPNVPEINRAVDTRAAVALLTRNIQIVSAGETANDPFTEKPKNYYGGHTIVRQGFESYQVQGVEFYLLGQGGAKGRYPVHFHMARRTPQQTDPTQGPLNFIKDSSIHESMTRWITIHATEGMYLARNVGFRSIGHGFYFEDATEINNKLYSNIGIMARAAIQNGQNPRMVPGILADTKTDGGDGDFMPYRSDFNHPTVFWMMNGWNDFEYNMAAGAATCGACYWWLPAGNSGPSQYETWDGYASQNIYDPAGNGNCTNIAPPNQPPKYVCGGNLPTSGLTPLHVFVGNSCVAAMSSFQTVSTTNECIGVPAQGSGGLAAVPTSAPKAPTDPNLFNLYYPTLTSSHNSTECPGADDPTKSVQCGNTKGVVPPNCASTAPGQCGVTVLDHYTTSFNWAETNFSAVWLRPKWYLVSNSAITDVQTGGINFVTGGGYTRSDIPLGYWSLMRKSVLVGHTQSQGSDGNPYAYDSGPFNPTTADEDELTCDTQDPNRCQSAKEGVTFLLPPFPGQRLFNIYDGPAFQEFNAYLKVTTTETDCKVNGNGNCGQTQYPLARNKGVLIDKVKSVCYLPNAAIAWKQPNGFYYPPSFISSKLWFENVDIRHFVVEPFFTFDPQHPNDPFVQSQSDITKRYCTYTSPDPLGNGTTFTGFNHIDRETVLNDEDGSLTGLVANDSTDKDVPTAPSISINEDSYFNEPLITPECLSDIGVVPKNPKNRVYTARTSPYKWLTTAIVADCAIQNGTKSGNLLQCQDDQNRVHWANACTDPSCRGVPLYREDLTCSEQGTQPSIRMMGQAISQRSTLALDHGAYYIDTTQGCTSQGSCPVCTPNPSGTDCMYCKPGTTDCWTNGNDIDPLPWHPTTFLAGHTYYVYFLYAKPTTKQTYDIYVGKNEEGKYSVEPVLANLPSGAFEFTPQPSGSWLSPPPAYNATTGTVRVSVDLTGQQAAFDDSKAAFCQPGTFCQVSGSGASATCGCKPGTQCNDPSICTWSTKELDCPQDPKNPAKMGCFGFSITMPGDFEAPANPLKPDPSLFQPFTDNPYFGTGVVTFSTDVEPSGKDCVYGSPPTEKNCTSTAPRGNQQ